ncbi:MAG: hypothetical protein IJM51_09285 [Clostridia bacterium]|nr:hypothetical protein [Clostridia bacterium]
MSVIFSAAITGLGHLAYAVANVKERMPLTSSEFELSQDGETVWEAGAEYTFVGFSEDGDFSHSVGRSGASVGRRLGRLKNEPDYRVWQLRTEGGEYIMLKGRADTAEVFRKVS